MMSQFASRGNFHLVILTGMMIEGVNDASGPGQKLQRALLEAGACDGL